MVFTFNRTITLLEEEIIDEETHTKEQHHVMMESETGFMLPQAKEFKNCQQPPEIRFTSELIQRNKSRKFLDAGWLDF